MGTYTINVPFSQREPGISQSHEAFGLLKARLHGEDPQRTAKQGQPAVSMDRGTRGTSSGIPWIFFTKKHVFLVLKNDIDDIGGSLMFFLI